MTEFNYLKEKRRMLDSLGRTEGICAGVACGSCPLSRYNNRHTDDDEVTCSMLEILYPEEATAIVRKWAEEHPINTRMNFFLKKCPNALINNEGYPFACAGIVGLVSECPAKSIDGYTCKKCWTEEVEE